MDGTSWIVVDGAVLCRGRKGIKRSVWDWCVAMLYWKRFRIGDVGLSVSWTKDLPILSSVGICLLSRNVKRSPADCMVNCARVQNCARSAVCL